MTRGWIVHSRGYSTPYKISKDEGWKDLFRAKEEVLDQYEVANIEDRPQFIHSLADALTD
jgi:hypothetical protein